MCQNVVNVSSASPFLFGFELKMTCQVLSIKSASYVEPLVGT